MIVINNQRVAAALVSPPRWTHRAQCCNVGTSIEKRLSNSLAAALNGPEEWGPLVLRVRQTPSDVLIIQAILVPKAKS